MKSKVKGNNVEGKSIDWSERQLLIGRTGIVVMSTEKHNEDCFSGTVIVKNDYYEIGETQNNWSKESFRIFEDKVILSN